MYDCRQPLFGITKENVNFGTSKLLFGIVYQSTYGREKKLFVIAEKNVHVDTGKLLSGIVYGNTKPNLMGKVGPF